MFFQALYLHENVEEKDTVITHTQSLPVLTIIRSLFHQKYKRSNRKKLLGNIFMNETPNLK